MNSKKYPMTLEEFKNRLFELFIERGNKKEDWHYFTDPKHYLEKKETLIESWYKQFCYHLDVLNSNHFTDEGLIERIERIEIDIACDNTEFPMTLEDFKERVTYLFLHTGGQDIEVKKQFLKEFLEEDSKFFENEYEDLCARYCEAIIVKKDHHPEAFFKDSLLISIPVNILESIY